MGAKLNKRMAAAAAILVGVAGVAQFANGLSTMFGPPSLPACESSDASELVRTIIADNYQVTLEKLDEVAETSFDEEAQKRACTAVIDAGEEGVLEIAYDLNWQDRDERMLYAQVQIGEQRQ